MPEAGRVITGSAGGLRLEAPARGTRPFSDKVKQALFSMAQAEREDVWDQPALDLFAGSGAAGIEALSRGAPAAVLVEKDGRAAGVIRRNLQRTHLEDAATVVRRDVLAYLGAPPAVAPSVAAREAAAPSVAAPQAAARLDAAPQAAAPFGFVVLDPPYPQVADLLAALELIGAPGSGWIDREAVVVAKHFWKDAPPQHVSGLVRVRERRFGETALSVYRPQPEHTQGGH